MHTGSPQKSQSIAGRGQCFGNAVSSVNIRYGSKLIELAKGKTAVEVTNAEDLVQTLDLIKSAVINGELDPQIEAASGQLRAGFKR
jgi:hypothetical protein